MSLFVCSVCVCVCVCGGKKMSPFQSHLWNVQKNIWYAEPVGSSFLCLRSSEKIKHSDFDILKTSAWVFWCLREKEKLARLKSEIVSWQSGVKQKCLSARNEATVTFSDKHWGHALLSYVLSPPRTSSCLSCRASVYIKVVHHLFMKTSLHFYVCNLSIHSIT